jgi:hypothetical protein
LCPIEVKLDQLTQTEGAIEPFVSVTRERRFDVVRLIKLLVGKAIQINRGLRGQQVDRVAAAGGGQRSRSEDGLMARSFSLGHIAITPGALAALRLHGVAPATLLDRHSRGDWGDIDAEDQGHNDQALLTGDRLFSVYSIAEGITVWVITEAADDEGERCATTILLPNDY